MPPPAQLTKLKLEQLEARDVPALWAVHFWGSVPGDTAATITDTLAANSSLPTNANGDTLVEANTIQEAIGLAIIGDVTVQFGGQTLIYSMAPGNVGASFAEHRPYVGNSSVIQLEDMTYSANGSDWDYNDRSWMVSVTDVSGGGSPPSPPTSPPPPYGYPTMVWITAGAGTTETSPTNGSFVVHRNNIGNPLTVNFGAVASTATDTATLDLDYTILGSGTSVTFAADSYEATILIHPLIDTVNGPYGPPDEPSESQIERVTLGLLGGTGYSVYTSSSTNPNEAFIQLGNVDLVFDLSVNADNDLFDPVDLAENYLPGYEGNTAKVSTGSSFNVPTYTGQQMKLVIDGVGKNSVDHIVKVEFFIDGVSAEPGYTGNRSDPNNEGVGNSDDFSFKRDGNERTITVDRDSFETTPNDRPYGGEIGAYSTWVNFYCKDYGGWAELTARITIQNANGGVERVVVKTLTVPLDDDDDGIADKWEWEMYGRRVVQYQEILNYNLNLLSPLDDNEQLDPDGADGPIVAQAETGDAHTVVEEYRGYILDGGSAGFAGGHLRLDPARKEVLVEMDRAAKLPLLETIGATGLKGVMNGAADIFSHPTRGAGIYMYWLMDEDALNLSLEKLDTAGEIIDELEASRDTVAERAVATTLSLKTDFIHQLFVDSIGNRNGGATANGNSPDLVERGTVIALQDLRRNQAGWGLVADKYNELLMAAVAHETTHLLVRESTGVFNENEHTVDANGVGGPADAEDKSDLIYEDVNRKRVEFDTVKIFPLIQATLRVKSSEAFVLDPHNP